MFHRRLESGAIGVDLAVIIDVRARGGGGYARGLRAAAACACVWRRPRRHHRRARPGGGGTPCACALRPRVHACGVFLCAEGPLFSGQPARFPPPHCHSHPPSPHPPPHLTSSHPPPPLTPLQVLLDIAHSLQYLHKTNVLHSDIKLSNVLLKSVRAGGRSLLPSGERGGGGGPPPLLLPVLPIRMRTPSRVS